MERYNATTPNYRTRSVQDLLSLKGKTVVITGGARGLGLSFARGCAEAGGNVAVIDRLAAPDPEFKLLETECGVKAKFYNGDVTDYAAIEALLDSIAGDFGGIDCLVTAAGIGSGIPLVDYTPEKIHNMFDVNVLGTIQITQLAVRRMIAQGHGGSIVAIASIGAHKAIPDQTNSIYCATKGAVLTFAKAAASELARHGIRVNSISPGFFLTPMTPGYLDKNVAKLRGFEDHIPLGRFADRAEIKSTLVMLLSDAGSYITGQDIVVDGGVLT